MNKRKETGMSEPEWKHTLMEYRAAKNQEWHVKYEKRMQLKAAMKALPVPSAAQQLWLNSPTVRDKATQVFPHTRAGYIAKGWIKAAA